MSRLHVAEHKMRSKVPVLKRRFETAMVTDKEAEATVKKFQWLTAWWIVCAIAGLFYGGMLAERGYPIALLLPVAAVAATVYSVVQWINHRKYDLDDRKVATIARFLTMIEADTPERALMRLEVDFRDYQKGGDQVSKEGGFVGPKAYKYSHPWLQVTGGLADGTGYQLRLVDTVGRKEKPKRKYTKVKETVRTTLLLQLKLKTKVGDTAPIAEILSSTPMPPGWSLQRRKVEGSGRVLRVALNTPPATRVRGRYGLHETGTENLIDGDKVLAALLWTYDGISRSRLAA